MTSESPAGGGAWLPSSTDESCRPFGDLTSCGFLAQARGLGMAQVSLDESAPDVQQRDQHDGRTHLVDVVDGAHREELRDGPVLRTDHEGDVQHDEAVEEL